MAVWIPMVATFVLALLRQVFKDRADNKVEVFKWGLDLACKAINAVAPNTKNTVDDRVAYGLSVLNGYFNAHGEKLSPIDEAKAKQLFAAMHPAGESK